MPVEESQIMLVKGLFEDTLQVNEPVAFAHIDSDWHDSVMICLQRIVPHLTVGGRLVIDDYFYWSGCRRAVDGYFADKRNSFTFTARQRLHIVRDR
jgi:asparagine synthase (glutamine-hydrolysing)